MGQSANSIAGGLGGMDIWWGNIVGAQLLDKKPLGPAVHTPGTETGLSEQDLQVARWKAQHFGAASAGTAHEVEEIRLDGGCYGTDTSVLEADVLRYARELDKK